MKQFHYKGKVKIIKGFYKGKTGKVITCKHIYKDTYLLSVSVRLDWYWFYELIYFYNNELEVIK